MSTARPLKVYVIGSLRNPRVPEVAKALREAGFEVFDDWYAAGERADDAWQEYEKARGRTYEQALQGHAAKHVFNFDKTHLDASDAAILVGPAGKSGHLELGYMIGKGKLGYILIDPVTADSRWDVMYQFADRATQELDQIIEDLKTPRVLATMVFDDVTVKLKPIPLPQGWHAAAKDLEGEEFGDGQYQFLHNTGMAP